MHSPGCSVLMTEADSFGIQRLNECDQNSDLAETCATGFWKWHTSIVQCTSQGSFQTRRLQSKIRFIAGTCDLE